MSRRPLLDPDPSTTDHKKYTSCIKAYTNTHTLGHPFSIARLCLGTMTWLENSSSRHAHTYTCTHTDRQIKTIMLERQQRHRNGMTLFKQQMSWYPVTQVELKWKQFADSSSDRFTCIAWKL